VKQELRTENTAPLDSIARKEAVPWTEGPSSPRLTMAALLAARASALQVVIAWLDKTLVLEAGLVKQVSIVCTALKKALGMVSVVVGVSADQGQVHQKVMAAA
jgi:hypothetical protein